MAGTTLDNWLGPLIENEVDAVMSWSKRSGVKTEPGVKPELDVERFSDDGSNFRSVVTSPPVDTASKVQLVKVTKLGDPIVCVVTDGYTSIQARLAGDAAATIEAAIEEPIDAGMSNDILLLRDFTIVSTPWGPQSGWIQLDIQNLEYLHHLRKPVGRAQPVQQRNKVAGLIAEMTKMRTQEFATPEPAATRTSPLNDVSPGARSQREPETLLASPGPQASLSSQRSSLVRTHSAAQASTQMQASQATIHTQIAPRRKRPASSLEQDGVQMQSGINLSLPQAPGFGPPGQPAPSVDRKAALLNLLKKQPVREAAPQHVQEIAQQSEVRPPPQLPPHSAQASKLAIRESPAKKTMTPKPVNNAPTQQAPSTPITPGSSLPLRRRKIPDNQKRLLEQKSSWIPSLPGHQFPPANIPIGLLKLWNAEKAPKPSRPPASASISRHATPRGPSSTHSTRPSSQRASVHSTPPQNSHVQQTPSKLPFPISVQSSSSVAMDTGTSAGSKHDSSEVEEEDSNEDPSSDEEISASQWPPSQTEPSPRKPELPPDSTMESEPLVKGTQASDLEMAVPRALPAARPPDRHPLPAKPPTQDPMELYHQRRTGYFRGVQRRDWLKSNYIPDKNAQTTCEAIRIAYVAAFPSDPVQLMPFLAAIRETYAHAVGTNGIQLRHRDVTRASQLDGPAETPRKSQKSYQASTPGGSQASQQQQAASPLLGAARGLQRGGHADQMLVEQEGDDSSDEEGYADGSQAEPMTIFGEFAHAWKNIKPGKPGNFWARDLPPPKARAKHRVDVLSWEL